MTTPVFPTPADDPAALARAALADGAPIVLLTGRAGTGKSYFIRSLTQDQSMPTALLAPTGLAAMNIGGQTVHSFFGFPPRPLIGLAEKPSWFFTQTARRIKRLIVDEVSMVRADVLDAMDSHLRAARRSQKPFGGVQMLLVGDFYQLPPVVRGDEGRMLEEAGYNSPFAFSAHVLRDASVSRFELETVHRQTDQDFIDLLSDIRERRRVQDAVARLNEACLNQTPTAGPPILLAGANAVADGYNARGLADLPGPAMMFAGGFKGDPPKTQSPDRFPAPMSLTLKLGARVIFTQNDSAGRWVNGSLGTVTAFTEELVSVRLDASGETVEAGRAVWPQARWQWNEKAQALEVKEEFRYVQFPLAPAWALTIHKAQGMTLDSVMIDLGRGAFAAGQTYVALSRARSLAGLRLARPLTPRDVQVDPSIAEGLERF
jgi:ATP-dependent DNA helicase PIF1